MLCYARVLRALVIVLPFAMSPEYALIVWFLNVHAWNQILHIQQASMSFKCRKGTFAARTKALKAARTVHTQRYMCDITYYDMLMDAHGKVSPCVL